MKSQADAILNHLKSGKTLTPLEALEYGMGMRLAARIESLKKQGHDIQKFTIFKNKKRFACYFIPRPAQLEMAI